MSKVRLTNEVKIMNVQAVVLDSVIKPKGESLVANEFLSVAEVAKRLNVTSRTVARWIAEGEFPGVFQVNPGVKNSSYLIPRKSYEQFCARRFGPEIDTENGKGETN